MFAAVRPPTKSEQIHAHLRAAILDGRLAPGHYLNIDELARQLKVSPIPLREAIGRLVADRLAVVRPHVGAEVAMLDAESVREVFTFMAGLESALADAIVARADKTDVAELETIIAEMGRLHPRREQTKWDEANTRFHLRLAVIGGLPAITDELRLLLEHWTRIRRHFFSQIPTERTEHAQREHRAMLSALRRKQARRLRELLHDHNKRAEVFYLKLLGKDKLSR